MKKESIIIIVSALVVGVLGGAILSNSKKDSTPGENPAASAPAIDYQQKIRTLKEIVAKEPENRNAWVQLGHNYFDSTQPMKAIEAYDKALELDGNDPDVLTDQGVMYRRFGWYDKAVENFTKANKLKPDHKQSLFNLGIVYRDDLQDTVKAKEAWTRYLEIAPEGEGADKVRTMLDHMENGHG
ncbi:MAG: tetratricopeptide repeat protein [Geopsychrobacter sp.]|nr:tetratricopeptide repeat protein [Geopsychrobacter sp.]